MNNSIKIINRLGEIEILNIDQIVNRIIDLSTNPIYGKVLDAIDAIDVANKTAESIYDGVSTVELDTQSCRIALSKYINHIQYGTLAARITISNHIKNIKCYFKKNTVVGTELYDILGRDPTPCEYHLYCYTVALKGVLSEYMIYVIRTNIEFIASILNENDNYSYSYSGFYLLNSSHYLLKILGSDTVVETPVYMLMRVAVSLATKPQVVPNVVVDLSPYVLCEEQRFQIVRTYRLLADKCYTHATPVMLNAGTNCQQFASCFLIFVDDSLKSIMRTQKISAMCQKYSGGIGKRVYLRSNNQVIHTTNGRSGGIVPWAHYTDMLGKYIDQGGGKRPGVISPQITVDHPDLLDVLSLRLTKSDVQAAQNHKLFYAVLVSDYFMECVYAGSDWYFISPDRNKTLLNVFGSAYKNKYLELVKNGHYVSKMPAVEVMSAILSINANSGLPYVINIDTANYMRNQNAPIYSSNLCAEVLVPSNENEVGVCNLTSITLSKFWTKNIDSVKSYEDGFKPYYEVSPIAPITNPITKTTYYFKSELFEITVRHNVRLINHTIDIGFYPVKQCRYSNLLRRPVGIGINSVADMLCKLGIVFGSHDACRLRANMEELILYYAMDESRIMAIQNGPIADHEQYRSGQGILHPLRFAERWEVRYPFLCDWKSLAVAIKKDGLYNSVFRCNMPTNNSSRIINKSPCFEPYESNIYRFNAFSIELLVVNKYLERYLSCLNIDIPKFKKRFIEQSGRLGQLELKYFIKKNHEMPDTEMLTLFKNIFRVAAFEISPMEIIDMCAAAQPFVDQSQSMNLWVENVSINTFNYYYYGYKRGLKTLVYYLKSNTATKEKVACIGCVL